MNYKYKFETILPKINNKTLLVLYRIWQFKIISRNNLINVCFFVDLVNLNSILDSLIKQKLVVVENNNSLKNMYSVTPLGCKKIFRNYAKPTFKYNNLNHDEKVFELIKKNQWTFFLTDREMISVIGWEEFKKLNTRLPDLVLLIKTENNWNYMAIELEITQKSIKRYEEIFNVYLNYFYENIFSSVRWYCTLPITKKLNEIKAIIDPHKELSRFFEITNL